ncbi:unnamed protein product, partial [Tetraodon nigroviridis]
TPTTPTGPRSSGATTTSCPSSTTRRRPRRTSAPRAAAAGTRCPRAPSSPPSRPASWGFTEPSWTTTRQRWRRRRGAARPTPSSPRSLSAALQTCGQGDAQHPGSSRESCCLQKQRLAIGGAASPPFSLLLPGPAEAHPQQPPRPPAAAGRPANLPELPVQHQPGNGPAAPVHSGQEGGEPAVRQQVVRPPDGAQLPGPRGGGAPHRSTGARRRAGRPEGQDLAPARGTSEGEGMSPRLSTSAGSLRVSGARVSPVQRANKGPKVLERLRKKLCEQESLLLLMSPSMHLRVHHRNAKTYCFLMSSDYERAEWRERIREQQKKWCEDAPAHLGGAADADQLLRQAAENPPHAAQCQCRSMSSVSSDEDSPGLCGFLNVIVHSASGLQHSLNLYCTLEVDSFGFFSNKAKTRVYRYTSEPKWNEEFEIELEGSQTLRLLCYEKCYSKNRQNREDGDTGGPDHRQRTDPSKTTAPSPGLRRERSKVPYLVRQCLEEIERRGLEEVGIYRVSGGATDIQALKTAFDTSEFLQEPGGVSWERWGPPIHLLRLLCSSDHRDVSVLMSEMDVNAIAGTLKLYFRELPEPLFTEELYQNFTGGIISQRAKLMCLCVRVAEKESINKMSLHNLATVFGPTLLSPPEKETKVPANPTQALSLGDSWSLEVMAQVKVGPAPPAGVHTPLTPASCAQVQVLLYFLQLETIPTPDSKRQSILFSTEV